MIKSEYNIKLISNEASECLIVANAIKSSCILDRCISKKYLKEKADILKRTAEFLLSMADED